MPRTPQSTRIRWLAPAIALSLALVLALGCVSPADHRKLENRVTDLARSTQGGKGAQAAELTADLQSLRAEVAELRGRVDIAERQAAEALAQSGRARREIAAAAEARLTGTGRLPAVAEDPDAPDSKNPLAAESGSAELTAYRAAYSEGRAGNHGRCIDQFRKFLQTYPASAYADDAAYWMADCHFEQEDYRNAVLRFDDVVRNYPAGNKAPDALYRQGESLLKLGPGFHEAAKRAFDRVVKEYPGSPPAKQAGEQLEALGSY